MKAPPCNPPCQKHTVAPDKGCRLDCGNLTDADLGRILAHVERERENPSYREAYRGGSPARVVLAIVPELLRLRAIHAAPLSEELAAIETRANVRPLCAVCGMPSDDHADDGILGECDGYDPGRPYEDTHRLLAALRVSMALAAAERELRAAQRRYLTVSPTSFAEVVKAENALIAAGGKP